MIERVPLHASMLIHGCGSNRLARYGGWVACGGWVTCGRRVACGEWVACDEWGICCGWVACAGWAICGRWGDLWWVCGLWRVGFRLVSGGRFPSLPSRLVSGRPCRGRRGRRGPTFRVAPALGVVAPGCPRGRGGAGVHDWNCGFSVWPGPAA